ncbi:FAD-dependent oxidoreductase [Thermomonospora umbrina]|uniref:FAD/FMN-containing dehydrogenase n=1 Tax=Thermomonospora umbrina TaxID=111806 RepID=A0A3D9SVP4_9ACTN|nr:FAD-binding protein [Thermomonospora umbrina]REE99657.1 FAD/FMN-containing dehydrogenase [Thermomonospora umbrina]
MPGHSRRAFFRDVALIGGATALLPAVTERTSASAAVAAGEAGSTVVTIRPGDRRYPDLTWGSNQRWVGTPDNVELVGTSAHVLTAVQQAVNGGKGFAVRSGGHCYEDFVANDRVRTVIDLAGLNAIGYDETRRVFHVEPGARLGDVYRTLYREWGVTLPGGSCPTVGVGGHVAGGGYGPLSRRHGLIVDHLWGVELVVVDSAGRASKVVATREIGDPNRGLWWAHTGGGGGGFGVVTRYLFRSPNVTGTAPADQLPKPPSEVIISNVSWSWSDMTEVAFTRLLRNFGRWYEANSSPDSPYAALFSQLKPQHRSAGSFSMTTQIDAAAPNAAALLDSYLAAVNEGTGVEFRVDDRRKISWLHAVTQWPGFTGTDTTTRFKGKSAYMRRGFTDANLRAFWRHMTRTDYAHPASLVMITAYGGRTNAVAAADTAVPQRDSILKLHYVSFWTDPAEDAAHLNWVRSLYQDVYAASGGVPAPNADTDGCFINYADADLADPRLNASGIPWHELYFKSGYRRLQTVKAQWDPKNLFHHSLSIKAV